MSDDEFTEEILEDIQEPDDNDTPTEFSGQSSPPLLNLDWEPLLPVGPSCDEAEGGSPSVSRGSDHVESPAGGDARGVPETEEEWQGVLQAEQEGDVLQIKKLQKPIILSTKGSRGLTSVVARTLSSPAFPDFSDSSLGSHDDTGDDPRNDRSLSEVSVSVPKLAFVSVGSNQRVGSLVRQFSHREAGGASPSDGEDRGRRQSLPPRLFGVSPPETPCFVSLAPSSQLMQTPEPLGDKAFLSKSRGNVANLVSQFSADIDESLTDTRVGGRVRSPGEQSPLGGGASGPCSPIALDKIDVCNEECIKDHSVPDETETKGDLDQDQDPSASSHSSNGTQDSPLPDDLDVLCNIAFPDSAPLEGGAFHANSQDADRGGGECEDDDEEKVLSNPRNELSSAGELSPVGEGQRSLERLQTSGSGGRSPDGLLANEDTSEELLEIDIGESDEDVFSGDLSDASEIIFGFISKSPISAITERTEESGGQENVSEENVDGCRRSVDSNGGAETARDVLGSGDAGYFASPLLSIGNDAASSQFTGLSSTQEESFVPMPHPSLGITEINLPPSSQSGCQPPNLARAKQSAKAKLASEFAAGRRSPSRTERYSTPSPSPGPTKACLHRVASKSLHDLGSGHAKPRANVLGNRSFSLSTDHLERQSPRAKSLSPGPAYEQRTRRGTDGRPHGDLTRRCISAVALNRTDSQASIRRNQSVSLNRLNRSRSSSMTSVSSWRKADYSHVPSKVRQYIRDMKDKDLRNSTRSLPTTPARKNPSGESDELRRMAAAEELLLRDLSYLEESEVPEAVIRLRNLILKDRGGGGGGDQSDLRGLDQLLQLWTMERKLRYASDTTLAVLQEHYNDLNALYAQKQNEIDRLRFFKDIHIYKEYKYPGRGSGGERRRGGGRYSCHTTPPNTPSGSMQQQQHFQTLPNTPTRRLSLHTTPPNTPHIRSPSPASQLNKSANSIQAVEPCPSITYEPDRSLACLADRAQGAMTGDRSVEERANDVTLEVWIRDANTVLKRVKEFALLEGSSALQQSERSLIWNSILTQYWRLSSQFPFVSLLPGSQQSGLLVQSLGQAVSGTASRFRLDLVPGACPEPEGAALEPSDQDVGGATGRSETREVVTATGNSSGNGILGTGGVTGHDPEGGDPTRPQLSAGGEEAKVVRESGGRRVGLDAAAHLLASSAALKYDGLDPGEPGAETEDAAVIDREALPEGAISGEEEEDNLCSRAGEGIRGREEEVASIILSPSPSHESMKTVGPLEKVTMWQESLIGSVVPHGSYRSSSNLSAAASLLSLGSSQPFEAPNHLDLRLEDFHALHGATLGLPAEGAGAAAAGDHPTLGKDGTAEEEDGDRNSLHKCDLPQGAWRSINGTPRLALGRSMKARDLDSGCPGSERSTKISLEIAEQPEVSDVLPGVNASVDDRLGVEREDAPSYTTEERGTEGRTYLREYSCGVTDSSVYVALAVGDGKEGRLDVISIPQDGAKPQGSETDSETPRRTGREVPREDVKEAAVAQSVGNSDLRFKEERNDGRKSQRSCRDQFGKSPPSSLSRSRRAAEGSGPDRGGSWRPESSPGRGSKQPSLRRYDARYTSPTLSSGSSVSSRSGSSSSSSVEIHNNISRLKRDLNILKSQMMNLTCEVLQGKKGKRKRSNSIGNKRECKRPVAAPAETTSKRPTTPDDNSDTVAPRRLHSSRPCNLELRVQRASPPCERDYTPTRAFPKVDCASTELLPSRPDDFASNLTERQSSYPRLSRNTEEEIFSLTQRESDDFCADSPSKNDKKKKDGMGIKDEKSSPGRDGVKHRRRAEAENRDVPRPGRDAARSPRSPLSERGGNRHALGQTESDLRSGKVPYGEFAGDAARRKGRSSSPLIYIQNYKCGREVASKRDVAAAASSSSLDRRQKGKSSKGQSAKCRKNGSSHNLMASLDQATTLAERLRLRSESMLTHLNLNVSTAHYELGQT